ncbi:MAG: hypothetical protein U0521_08485 [Anaerolineae bacterium]
MSEELPVLRIRLAAIDGWMLGRISMISSDDDGGLPDVRLYPLGCAAPVSAAACAASC